MVNRKFVNFAPSSVAEFSNIESVYVLQENKRYISPITGPRYPESYRKFRFPNYLKMARGKVVSLTHRLFLPPGNTPGTHFC